MLSVLRRLLLGGGRARKLWFVIFLFFHLHLKDHRATVAHH